MLVVYLCVSFDARAVEALLRWPLAAVAPAVLLCGSEAGSGDCALLGGRAEAPKCILVF